MLPLLHGLHYWLVIAIEEQVFLGQIDRDYGAISPSQVRSLRTCAEFGTSLVSQSADYPPETVVSGLRKTLESSSSDTTSARAILYALRYTTDVLTAHRVMKSPGTWRARAKSHQERKSHSSRP
jgi:hypothetical protein